MLRKLALWILKVAVLTGVLVVVFLASSALAMPSAADEMDPAQAGGIIGAMLLVGLVDVLVVLLVVQLSSWRGWPLVLGLTFAFYGVQTFLGQIEALFFLTPLAESFGAGQAPQIEFPVENIGGLFLMGVPLALALVPLTVLLFGKLRGDTSTADGEILGMTWKGFLVKLPFVVVLYILLYLGFGYYVAWQNPEVLSFYGGTDPGSFGAQLAYIARETPGLYGLQLVRALLWVAFSAPVIAMLRSRGWLGALVLGLFLALPMNIQHVLPNPYMPDAVRAVHFVETASSNFLFGLALFWLLHRSHGSVRALLGFKGGKGVERAMAAGPMP